MLPPHRPAMASTSNPAQLPSSGSVPLRTPEPSPRIRKDAAQMASQDVRVGVGRHRDKLEIIRDSLRPFEQCCTPEPPAATAQAQCNNDANTEDEARRQIMLKTLTQIGFKEDAAMLALQLVRFSSVAAAAEVLFNINKDHVFQQEFPRVTNGFPQAAQPGATPAQLAAHSTSYANNNFASHCASKLDVGYLSRKGDVGYSSPKTEAAFSAQKVSLGPTLGLPEALCAGYAQQMATTSTGNLDDSCSSRSDSPLARIPSPPSAYNVRSPSPTRQIAGYHQPSEYHRTHVHLTLSAAQALASGYDQVLPSSSQIVNPAHSTPVRAAAGFVGGGGAGIACSRKVERPHPQQASAIVSIERGAPGTGDRMVRPSTSLTQRQFPNGSNPLRRTEAVPVIRTRLERPHNTLLQINVDPAQMAPDGSYRNRYLLNAIDDETGDTVTVHGNPAGMTGVQNILVNPDFPSSGYAGYIEQYRKKVLSTTGESEQAAGSASSSDHVVTSDACNRGAVPSKISPASAPASTSSLDADGVTRCISPLPECVSKRVLSKTYESIIKPCRPRMFCFFMEQHVERLIQQYKERQQRAQQLAKEMECADLPEIMREQMMKFLIQKESRYLRLRRQKMDRNMFEIIKHIGFGAFGRVSLVKKKDTGQVYAMKTLLKKDVIMKQQAAHVKAERDILAEADSEWIVKLFFSFQDQQTLYFIMEYVPGGDMMQLLINKGIFYEKLARFYIAELTCAIEYVHSLGFIHRDIKPDNILIDQLGHLKLTDFGLCTGLRWTHDKRYYGLDNEETESTHSRQDSFTIPPGAGQPDKGDKNKSRLKLLDFRHHSKRNQSHSLVGTDNYMAPEVISGTGHTQLCDWWSVGVILYEMVYGRPPFMSEDRYETQFKIVHWRQFLDLSNRMGAKLSSDCINMIRRLCCDQDTRLGSENGAEDLKAHPWFKGVDFNTLRDTRAEFIPRVDHPEDTSNFDTFDVDSSDQSFDTMAKRVSSNTASNPAFYEFTFRHFFDFDGQGCPSLRRQPARPSLAPVFESNGRSERTQPSKQHQKPQVLKQQQQQQVTSYKAPVAQQLSDGFESDESLVV